MRLVWGLVLATAVMVAGFWPSFFSNPLQNDLLHTVHGALAAGWMLILILQAWLMARGHVAVHHWIGRLSPLWVLALVITAAMIVRYGVAASGPTSLPLPWRPVLTWIDIPSVILFAGFYAAALVCAFRRAIDLHYRFMVCTVIVIFSPALARLLARTVPAFHGLMGALHPTFILIELACVALIVHDYVRYRRTYAPFWLALAGQVAIEWTMFQAPRSSVFMNLLRVMGLPAA